MSRPWLSETATAEDCDWAFSNHAGAWDGLTRMTDSLGPSYGVDAEDLLHDLALWIAVRPSRTALYDLDTDDGLYFFLRWAYQHAHELAESNTRHNWRLEELPSYDPEG